MDPFEERLQFWLHRTICEDSFCECCNQLPCQPPPISKIVDRSIKIQIIKFLTWGSYFKRNKLVWINQRQSVNHLPVIYIQLKVFRSLPCWFIGKLWKIFSSYIFHMYHVAVVSSRQLSNGFVIISKMLSKIWMIMEW